MQFFFSSFFWCLDPHLFRWALQIGSVSAFLTLLGEGTLIPRQKARIAHTQRCPVPLLRATAFFYFYLTFFLFTSTLDSKSWETWSRCRGKLKHVDRRPLGSRVLVLALFLFPESLLLLLSCFFHHIIKAANFFCHPNPSALEATWRKRTDHPPYPHPLFFVYFIYFSPHHVAILCLLNLSMFIETIERRRGTFCRKPFNA